MFLYILDTRKKVKNSILKNWDRELKFDCEYWNTRLANFEYLLYRVDKRWRRGPDLENLT